MPDSVNTKALYSLVEDYKDFIRRTKMQDEVYKWRLVDEFKGRPDTSAPDFTKEIYAIKFQNLIYNLAYGVTRSIAKNRPEEFRACFIDLFDETVPLSDRMERFNSKTLEVYKTTDGKHGHHQDERSMATYLTFHDPKRYTFYKSSFYKPFCHLMGEKEAGKFRKYGHYLQLLNAFIDKYIRPDQELIEMVKSYIPEYYDGSNNLLLAQDILFCILDRVRNTDDSEVSYWIYAPGENANMWDEFFRDGIMALGWDKLGDIRKYSSQEEIADKLRVLEDTRSSKKNDAKANYEFVHSISSGDVIFVKKGNSKLLGYGVVTGDCEFDDQRKTYKNYRKVAWKKNGEWDAGHNLVQKTLTNITTYPTDLAGYDFYYERLLACMGESINKKTMDVRNLFADWLIKNPKVEYFGNDKNKILKELNSYVPYFESDPFIVSEDDYEEKISSLNEVLKSEQENEFLKFSDKTSNHRPRAILGDRNYFRFLREYFGKERSSGDFRNDAVNTILYGPPGTGKTFTLKKDFFSIYISKETSITSDQHFESVVRDLTWWQVIAIALREMGECKVGEIARNEWVVKKAKLSNSNSVRPTIWGQLQSHTVESCEFVNVKSKQQPFIFNKSEDSFWTLVEEELNESYPEIYEIIDSVKNFNPDPDKEIKRYVFTTFHQSYSYEDFIEGIKPVLVDGENDGEVNYRIEDGVFKDLCKRAELDPENRYAIFIDEINRANVSGVFGELITLIEGDKRQGAENAMSAVLPYSKKSFSVPYNVDIYGTMNTADRSVEALDTALRRRFSFVEMLPEPELLKDKKIEGIELKKLLEVINERIEVLVDRDHTVGHAFFINDKNLDDLRNTFANKIIPLLQEYFYGDYSKMEMVIGTAFFEVKDVSKVKFAVRSDEFEAEGKVYHIKNISDPAVMSDTAFVDALNQLIKGYA